MLTNRAFHISWLAGIGAFLFCTACTLAPASAEPGNMQEEQIQDSLISVMEAVKQDWNSGSYDTLKFYWDQNDENPIYLAEEADLIMITWPEIEAYWQATEAWVEWIVIDYRNYRVKRVDENNAIITFDLRFDLKLNDRANPIGGDNRGVVSFRKVDGTWKIHTWVEAPLSAITYMRKLYELNVRDDLPER
ncbi:MAG: hypothetical protein Hens3KO_08310 [Henriciella sp.]